MLGDIFLSNLTGRLCECNSSKTEGLTDVKRLGKLLQEVMMEQAFIGYTDGNCARESSILTNVWRTYKKHF